MSELAANADAPGLVREPASVRQFRLEARAWLEEHAPRGRQESPPGTGEYDLRRAWQRELFEGGWAGITWPEAYGGRGAGPLEFAAYIEEAARVGAPDPLNLIGLTILGPTIIDLGTDEQKARYLPAMLSGDEVWCQGFSEPDAGSDVASLRTRAVLDGDEWVVDGQKVWTSYAEVADWCVLLVRSDPDAPPRAGLTALIVDMHSPGVEVRPIRHMTGDPEFNEIFLDGARVPRDNVLGEEGGGWHAAITTLMHERRNIGTTFLGQVLANFSGLLEVATLDRGDGRPIDDPGVARHLARLATGVEALRITARRILLDPADTPGPEGALLKLGWSRLNQEMTSLAWDLLAPESLAISTSRAWTDSGYWAFEMLRARANSIEAGTTEILYNLVAERVLGLPRSR